MLGELLGNLQLRQFAQITVIVVDIAHKILHILSEIEFKLQRFGILVVDVGARDSGLVGARLVRKGHITDAGHGAEQGGVEGQHGGERRMAIEVSFGVQFQQIRVYLALEHDDVLRSTEPRNAGALERGPARVDDEGHHLPLGAQFLQGDHRVLAPANGDNHPCALPHPWECQGTRVGRANRKGEVHEIVRIALDPVLVAELAQPIPIELAPPVRLLTVEPEGLDVHQGTACALPIAHQLYHADIENDALQRLQILRILGILTSFQHHFRLKLNLLPYLVKKLDVQITILQTVIVSFIGENRILLAKFFECHRQKGLKG